MVVLEEYPNEGIARGAKRNLHRFPLDSLLQGQSDSEFYSCIDGIEFPRPKPKATEPQADDNQSCEALQALA
jgi:hypothetical protein